jgi:hypothetical protein
MGEGGAFSMKKATKKAALGLALALTITTAIGCSPDNDAARDDVGTTRGAGVYDTNDVRGGDQNRLGMNNNRAYGGVNHYIPPAGDVERYRYGAIGNRDGANTGNMNLGTNDGTRNGALGRTNDDRIRGGGPLHGGAGYRMHGARTDLGITNPNGLGANNNDNVRRHFNGTAAYDTNRADDIKRRVMDINGVNDARVLLYGNSVIVGVDADNNDTAIRTIRQDLQGVARGEHIHVTTDRALFNRIGDADDRLRRGETANDLGGILNDMGRTITAPFRNR